MESRDTQDLCSGNIEKQFERFTSRSRKRHRKAVVLANAFPTRKPRLMQIFSLETGTGARMEKVMAPHSSTLALKIPWMEEPGGLQSMRLRRVGHD